MGCSLGAWPGSTMASLWNPSQTPGLASEMMVRSGPLPTIFMNSDSCLLESKFWPMRSQMPHIFFKNNKLLSKKRLRGPEKGTDYCIANWTKLVSGLERQKNSRALGRLFSTGQVQFLINGPKTKACFYRNQK